MKCHNLNELLSTLLKMVFPENKELVAVKAFAGILQIQWSFYFVFFRTSIMSTGAEELSALVQTLQGASDGDKSLAFDSPMQGVMMSSTWFQSSRVWNLSSSMMLQYCVEAK